MSLGLFSAISYLLCILLYFWSPELASNHAVLVLFLPGFKLLTWPSFFLGLIESFGYGWLCSSGIRASVQLLCDPMDLIGGHGMYHGQAGPCPYCGSGSGRAALDVLEDRFARGEIDKAEFEEKRKLLGR